MSQQAIGLVIGGLLPAFFFGVSSIFAKSSNSAGIGLGYYMLLIGISVIIAGTLCMIFSPERTLSFPSGRDAFLAGATWAIGAASVAVAIAKFNAPISQLVPLYNTNTLVGVLLGLWLFSEWQDLDVTKLLLGSVLIIVGSTLVAWA